jgi:hypothetical protein
MKPDELTAAFNAGAQAQKSDATRSENPYSRLRSFRKFTAWDFGFDIASGRNKALAEVMWDA